MQRNGRQTVDGDGEMSRVDGLKMCGIKVAKRSTPITIIKSGSRCAALPLPAAVASGGGCPAFHHSDISQQQQNQRQEVINQSINRLTSCCVVSVVVDDVAPMLVVVLSMSSKIMHDVLLVQNPLL